MEINESLAVFACRLAWRALRTHLRHTAVNAANDNRAGAMA